MIVIMNYGLGNVHAFLNLYKKLHIPVKVANTSKDLDDASRLILPGVGAFDYAMKLFSDSGMRESAEKKIFEANTPVLGVCVGMQMLADGSDEGSEPGLGWIKGRVTSLSCHVDNCNLPIPHMGWNDVQPIKDKGIFSDLAHGSRFYFLHSYFFQCQDPDQSIATANYGGNICCAVQDKQIMGVQFHPEKSHHFGAKLLFNFATQEL